MSTADFDDVKIEDVQELEKEIAMRETASATEMEARDVSVWFGKRKVLEGVSIAFPKNTVTALIGPMGGGKSLWPGVGSTTRSVAIRSC